jgi:uncharacterized protein
MDALAPAAATYAARRTRLSALLAELPDLVVAVSGGVDSAVLLHAAARALGPRCAGVIGDSPSLPRRDLDEARALAARIGVELAVLPTEELLREEYRRNDGTRCYWCRQTLFEAMERWARARRFTTLAYGEITDDLGEHRPGRAAAAELAVRAPLSEAGLSKDDVRRYAREHGLAVAEKPASACLASRLAPGTPVTRERLARVERAEELVRGLGFGLVRVRDRGDEAGLEVEAHELARADSLAEEIGARLAPLGFARLALAAYRRPGAPDEAANARPRAHPTSR